MPTEVLLIRHGKPTGTSRRWQGRAPVPLNEAGLAQAQALARYLAARQVPIDALQQPAAPRAADRPGYRGCAWADRPPDDRLREVDVGDWQGLSHDEIEAWDGERFAAYLADWYHTPTPNGESRMELQVRARAAFDDITARHCGATIAIVSHGGTLGMLLESLLGKIERPSLANTSITVLKQPAPGQPWELAAVGLAPHLNEEPLGETW